MKCSAGPESYCLSLYRWRHSSGRLNGGGEASFFLNIFTSNLLCGFLCGLCVCCLLAHCILPPDLGRRTGQQTTQLAKIGLYILTSYPKQQNKQRNKQVNKTRLFCVMLKFLLAEYCSYSRLQDYLQLQ